MRYKISLGNENNWIFIPNDETESFVKEFGENLMLASCNKNKDTKKDFKIFFQNRSQKETYAFEELKKIKGKWRGTDLKALKYYKNKNDPYSFRCEINLSTDSKVKTINMWASLCIVYQKETENGALPLHAALLEKDGNGILLVGPSGFGKTTLSNTIPKPWQSLSDDQTLIVKNKNGKYLAHPMPTWSEHLWHNKKTKWDIQKSLRLKAICFIEKAKKEEITLLKPGRAVALLNASSEDMFRIISRKITISEKRFLRKKVFENACQLAKKVPAYHLKHSLNGKSWKLIEGVI